MRTRWPNSMKECSQWKVSASTPGRKRRNSREAGGVHRSLVRNCQTFFTKRKLSRGDRVIKPLAPSLHQSIESEGFHYAIANHVHRIEIPGDLGRGSAYRTGPLFENWSNDLLPGTIIPELGRGRFQGKLLQYRHGRSVLDLRTLSTRLRSTLLRARADHHRRRRVGRVLADHSRR